MEHRANIWLDCVQACLQCERVLQPPPWAKSNSRRPLRAIERASRAGVGKPEKHKCYWRRIGQLNDTPLATYAGARTHTHTQTHTHTHTHANTPSHTHKQINACTHTHAQIDQ